MLNPTGLLQMDFYVNATFALHEDSKSHKGIVIFVRKAMVFAVWHKQKIVTKSPRESKLVALINNIGLLSHLQNVLYSLSMKK